MPKHVIISKKKLKASVELIKQGYSQLETVADDVNKKMYLLLNTKKKTFYYLDEECLKQAIKLIENTFKKKPKILTLNDIKEWE